MGLLGLGALGGSGLPDVLGVKGVKLSRALGLRLRVQLLGFKHLHPLKP